MSGSGFSQTRVGDQVAPPNPTAAVASTGSLASKLKDAQASIAAVAGIGAVPTTQQRSIAKHVPQITQPKLLSPSHVLFKSTKLNLGAQYKGKILKFIDGYYQTRDTEEITYLKANAKHFDVSVVSTLPSQTKV